MELKNHGVDEREEAARDLRVCEALFRVAVQDRRKWEEIARLTFPELLEAADLQEEHQQPKDGGMPLCDYAATLMQFLTSAHVSYITPLGERWFQFAPWESDVAGDESWMEVGSWYSKATQVCQEALERTNFYTENIATYNDRGVTGTGAMLCEQTADGEIVFTHVPAGTYGIAENGVHKVDTFVRRFRATPAQMVHLFGEERLSAETKRSYASEDDRYTKQVEVYQLIEPRRGKDVSWDVFEQDARKMPYRSVYIEKASGTVVMESGYTEFPVYVTRFLRYGNYPYGRSALATVLQTMKDLVKLQDMEVTAADAEHIAGELMKRFRSPRPVSAAFADKLISVDAERGAKLAKNLERSLTAIPLVAHEALTTAYINDVDGLGVFAQQLFGYGREGDVFLGISTSGNSENILNAAVAAKAMGVRVVGMTGTSGGKLAGLADVTVCAPAEETYLIQELHLPIYHCWCLMLEERFFGGSEPI